MHSASEALVYSGSVGLDFTSFRGFLSIDLQDSFELFGAFRVAGHFRLNAGVLGANSVRNGRSIPFERDLAQASLAPLY
jgi:hypothetical protein